jgi:hypothetical protein
VNCAFSTDGFVETETPGVLPQLRQGESVLGRTRKRRAFGAKQQTQRGLSENGQGAQDEISGAGMTPHLPLGEAAPHKMIRNSVSERLQQCEIKLTRGYCCGIAACITIRAQLT